MFSRAQKSATMGGMAGSFTLQVMRLKTSVWVRPERSRVSIGLALAIASTTVAEMKVGESHCFLPIRMELFLPDCFSSGEDEMNAYRTRDRVLYLRASWWC